MKEEKEAINNDRDLHKPVKRLVTRKHQPKLNLERLSGDRGLMKLMELFQSFTPQGKGYEKDDLDSVMKHLEHWSFRLFPSLLYHDVLERIENLGGKKPIQTYLKKFRLDMLSDDTAKDDTVSETLDGSVVNHVILGGMSNNVGDLHSSTALFDDLSASP